MDFQMGQVATVRARSTPQNPCFTPFDQRPTSHRLAHTKCCALYRVAPENKQTSPCTKTVTVKTTRNRTPRPFCPICPNKFRLQSWNRFLGCLYKCCERFGFGAVALATSLMTFPLLLNVTAKRLRCTVMRLIMFYAQSDSTYIYDKIIRQFDNRKSTLYSLPETVNGCYLHMLCSFFCCFCVCCRFWRIKAVYITGFLLGLTNEIRFNICYATMSQASSLWSILKSDYQARLFSSNSSVNDTRECYQLAINIIYMS